MIKLEAGIVNQTQDKCDQTNRIIISQKKSLEC